MYPSMILAPVPASHQTLVPLEDYLQTSRGLVIPADLDASKLTNTIHSLDCAGSHSPRLATEEARLLQSLLRRTSCFACQPSSPNCRSCRSWRYPRTGFWGEGRVFHRLPIPIFRWKLRTSLQERTKAVKPITGTTGCTRIGRQRRSLLE